MQCANPIKWNTADAEVYLGGYQTSMTERFCENSLQRKAMLFIYLFVYLFTVEQLQLKTISIS